MDARFEPTAAADLRPVTKAEVREFWRMMKRLWGWASNEAFYLTYLLDRHPKNLAMVTEYSELLEERGAMIRNFAETYGVKPTAPDTFPATLADLMGDLLAYFAKSDERMLTLLREMYGRTSPRQSDKC